VQIRAAFQSAFRNRHSAMETGGCMIPLSWYVMLSAALFTIGVVGVFSRRNIFIILMSIELMLNAANINLVAFSHYLQSLTGQVFAIFVITVAAAEAAVALAIIILISRNRGTVYADEFTIMKG
jgi:NADH-quinone oxidoreductase subunit K